MTDNLYICVGENFGYDCRIGFCGKIRTLEKWIEELFSDRVEEAKAFFEGDRDKAIIDYILKNKGKRLKRVDKSWKILD